jgi:hypothetical protein
LKKRCVAIGRCDWAVFLLFFCGSVFFVIISAGFFMAGVCTIGKRQFGGDELLPLLSGYNLLPQLMQGMVVDRALRTLSCSPAERAAFYGAEIAADAGCIEKKKAQLLLEGTEESDLDFFIDRPVLLERFKKITFEPQLGSTFLKLKAGLDRVVFFMLRNKDHELTRELFFRLESGEDSFESLASRFSEGRESTSGGRVGPVEMKQLNPALARFLSTAKAGVVNPPIVLDGFGVIILLQEKIPAKLDEGLKPTLVNHLFQEWVQAEIKAFFF